jgi:hypothetical protein
MVPVQFLNELLDVDRLTFVLIEGLNARIDVGAKLPQFLDMRN